MRMALFVWVVWISTTHTTWGQRVTGSIKNTAGEGISAYIELKNSRNGSTIDFFQSENNGTFDFTLTPNPTQKTIYLLFRAMGYTTFQDSLVVDGLPLKNLQVTLQTESIELEEVVVAVERKVVVKNDTTVYNAKSFLKGNERKVEDLLRNIPGIVVEENGKIQYYGKIVESVQLNGDDLFGSKYSIGTRNIPVDLVEKVEAITNFNKNPVLQGLVNSETVSLNLQFKKMNLKLLADGNVGIGTQVFDQLRRDVGLNLLSLFDNFKAFSTLTTNNIGTTYGGSDYFYTPGAGENLEENPLERIGQAEQLIQNDFSTENVHVRSERINDEYTASQNALFKLSEKLTLKSGISYLRDNWMKEFYTRQDFLTEDIFFDDATLSNKSFRDLSANFKATYLRNKKTLWVGELDLLNENRVNDLQSTLNQTSQLTNQLRTSNQLWKGQLELTKRLNEKNGLVFKGISTVNTLPQQLTFVSEDAISSQLPSRQSVDLTRRQQEFRATYLKKMSNGTMGLATGLRNMQDALSSQMILGQGKEENDLTSSHFSYFMVANTSVKVKKLTTSGGVIIEKYKQSLNNQLDSDANESINRWFILPKLVLRFDPKPMHKITAEVKANNTPIYSSSLYSRPIFQGNRLALQNIPSLLVQETKEVSSYYQFQDLFLLITAKAGLSYRRNTNVSVNRLAVNENYSITLATREPLTTESVMANVHLEKFLTTLKISIKYAGSAGYFNYFNYLLEQPTLRENTSTYLNHNLFFRTSFDLPFVIQNNFSMTSNTFQSDGVKQGETLRTLSNKAEFLILPSKSWNISNSLSSIYPNMNKKEVYHFWNAEVTYKFKPKSKLMDVRLIGSNLLNTSLYKTFENSDFVVAQFSSNLAGRYIMLSTSFRL